MAEPALLSATGESGAWTSLLLAGSVAGIEVGDAPVLAPRTWPSDVTELVWAQLSVVSVGGEPDPAGGENTRVAVAQLAANVTWTTARAADYRLLTWTQSAALWSQSDDIAPLKTNANDDTQLLVNLSATARGIAPGDLVLLDSLGHSALGLVTAVSEQFGSVPYPGATGTPPSLPDIPLAYTALTLSVPSAGTIVKDIVAAGVAVRFGLRDLATLIPTPPATLAALPADVIPPAGFTLAAGGAPAYVEDSTGSGIAVNASPSAAGDGTLTLASTTLTPATFTLAAPLRLLVDLVEVSRGTTVAAESLGMGDASLIGQTFTLKQSPLTYLASDSGYVSTLQVSVDGIRWSEVVSFYGQPPQRPGFRRLTASRCDD